MQNEMTLDAAMELADHASPAPWIASQALKVMRAEINAANAIRQSEGVSDEDVQRALDSWYDLEDGIHGEELRERMRAALTAVWHDQPAQDQLYRHACDAVEEWKHRALEAEESVERMTDAMNDVCGPTSMGEPVLPAQEKAEPVATRFRRKSGHQTDMQWSIVGGTEAFRYFGNDGDYEAELLYTAPPAERVRVPDGWKLVPVEPTQEMIKACIDVWQQRLQRKSENGTLLCGGNPEASFRENYAAMLSAAPEGGK